jgi:hypothetical protein
MFGIRGLLVGVCLLWLSACAVVSPVVTPPALPVSAELPQAQEGMDKNYWWFVRVKVVWPEEEPIAWYMDVLLAHQLFKPVLLKYAHDIELWRFHRRAGRDKAGHRFSFIFYAREATATAILNNLAENPLIPKLMGANRVEKIVLYEANKKPNSAIEATSDKNWSLTMQRAWPYFAMGGSQVWLSLIDQYAASAEHSLTHDSLENNDDIEALLAFYRQIDEKIVTTWEEEGGHAFLHHLNALFGYGDVAIYERRMIRF